MLEKAFSRLRKTLKRKQLETKSSGYKGTFIHDREFEYLNRMNEKEAEIG